MQILVVLKKAIFHFAIIYWFIFSVSSVWRITISAPISKFLRISETYLHKLDVMNRSLQIIGAWIWMQELRQPKELKLIFFRLHLMRYNLLVLLSQINHDSSVRCAHFANRRLPIFLAHVSIKWKKGDPNKTLIACGFHWFLMLEWFHRIDRNLIFAWYLK